MTAEQRDHFSIKNGFGKEYNAGLFDDMNDDEKQAWAKGLGDEVIHWLKTYKSALTAEALKKRDHHGDLTKIMLMILCQL